MKTKLPTRLSGPTPYFHKQGNGGTDTTGLLKVTVPVNGRAGTKISSYCASDSTCLAGLLNKSFLMNSAKPLNNFIYIQCYFSELKLIQPVSWASLIAQ